MAPRLLILRDHIDWSGGMIHFLELLPRLDPARIAATFCVLGDPAPEAAAFEAGGARPASCPGGGAIPSRCAGCCV